MASLRSILYKRYKSPIILECYICMNVEKTPLLKLESGRLYNRKQVPAKLSDVNQPIPDNSIFLGNCDKHAICKECLVKIATSNNQINEHHSLIRCLYPFEDCNTNAGIAVYFTHQDIQKILTPTQFDDYLNHAELYRFPGFKIVKCPLAVFRRICNTENVLPLNLVSQNTRGGVIVTCVQNPNCLQRWCFHCERKIYGNVDICRHCNTIRENKDPFAWNRYFYNPLKKYNDNQSHLLKNCQLTPEIVINQIKEKASSDQFVRCFECLLLLHKTEDCNGLNHDEVYKCGIEVCNACGRTSLKNQPLIEHWSEYGKHGCPRWDNSPYWTCVAKINWKCMQDVCYGHDRSECTESTHQEGIQGMIRERRAAHIYHALISLLPELRQTIVSQLKADPSFDCSFLPSDNTLELIDKPDTTVEMLTAYSEKALLHFYSPSTLPISTPPVTPPSSIPPPTPAHLLIPPPIHPIAIQTNRNPIIPPLRPLPSIPELVEINDATRPPAPRRLVTEIDEINQQLNVRLRTLRRNRTPQNPQN